jgi:transcriptional regulator with XRE-family HTH domain
MEQTLGKRIAENRKRLGMTQDALAEKLGITAQAVSKWENDQSCPDITMLPRLCDIFGITTDELLGREQAKPVHEAEVVTDGSDDDGIHLESDNGKWEVHWDSSRRGAVAFAILVIWVGALSVVARLLNWDVSFWDILWPSALLVFGTAGLFHKFSFFNIGMMLFGAYFLVDHLNILELGIGNELLFPIAVVLFGLSLLADALKKPKKSKFRVTHNGKEKETHSSFQVDDRHFDCNLSFGDQRYLIESELLESGKATVSFGSMVVDLSACPQVAEDCRIEAACSFGELILMVPRRFRVEPAVGSTFANIECTGHADAQPQGVIRLDGSVNFGEIQVKYI